jgi:hypothetical protein
MTKLQVADTARQAVGVLTASRPELGGYVRVLNPPSCQRCAILAGRFYRWSTGFQRHPRCDCVNLPSEQAGWAKSEGFLTDPMQPTAKADPRPDQAQVEAIENGADIGQVVNATRGMSTTALTTREGVSRRGIAGKKLGNFAREPGQRYSMSQTPRLTPEAIYQTGRRQGRSDRAPARARLHPLIFRPSWAASTCTGDLQSRTGADMTSDTSTTADADQTAPTTSRTRTRRTTPTGRPKPASGNSGPRTTSGPPRTWRSSSGRP